MGLTGGYFEFPAAHPQKEIPLSLEYGTRADVLVREGRERKWVRARAMLVYLAREWSEVKVVELGKRLHRDPSLISRLYSFYAGNRDKEAEARLGRLLRRTEISP